MFWKFWWWQKLFEEQLVPLGIWAIVIALGLAVAALVFMALKSFMTKNLKVL